MNKRIEKILARVNEKQMEKQAAMYKEALLPAVGGVTGATVGGLGGMGLGARFAPGKYKALAALLGLTGGAIGGGMMGTDIGRDIVDRGRQRNYDEIIEAANNNAKKAIIDSIAMKAFRGAGLAQPPYPPV